MKNIYLQIFDKQPVNESMALATITATTGSTPQKPGSSALFGLSGLISGTVGGGILEAKVQQLAREAILLKKSGFYHFSLDNDISQPEEAICGGKASILIDAVLSDHKVVFEQIGKSMMQRVPGILATRVTGSGNNQVSVHRTWIKRGEETSLPPGYSPEVAQSIAKLLMEGNWGDFSEFYLPGPGKDEMLFLEPVIPFPRLVIAGAGHIGRALAHLGNLLGFEVMVVDERADYANPDKIPDADQVLAEDIGHAMQSLKKTADTYIVIVTRGHKNDADALRSCIGSGVAYIGMIGSKKKIALMRRNFLEEGWASPDQWDSVYAPIGLDIHSESVQEIAVSIAAQLIAVRNSKVHAHA